MRHHQRLPQHPPRLSLAHPIRLHTGTTHETRRISRGIPAVTTRHHPLSRKIIITAIGVDLEVVTGRVSAVGSAIAIGKVTANDFMIPRAVPPVGTGEQVDRGARPEVDTEEAPVGGI
jgi:hypothetical protein